jgi:hypothetical protein
MAETHVEVVVVTTSGSYPTTGTDRVSAHQPVRNQLAKAARELHIVDTAGWIARVDGREIDVEKSYVENHLAGTVRIDYGPREGGGGDE